MRTRGAHSCVRSTPTGLPDWTRSVSSSARPPQLADDRVEGLPRAGGLAGAAVDHQLVRLLGDLGIEVVHQHPERGFLAPAAAAERAAPRRPDGSRAVNGAVGGGRCHGPIVLPAVRSGPQGRQGLRADQGRRAAISCSPNFASPMSEIEISSPVPMIRTW